jgi:hypothetical protein
VLTPTAAAAHAFAQRYDLPLPLWHYLAGAGATVALTFVVAALVLREGRGPPVILRIDLPSRLVRIVTMALRGFGLFAFALLLAAGFFGEQGDWDGNLLPVTLWIAWWVGFAFVSASLGNLWPLLDPWRSVGTCFTWQPPFAWPRWLGAWPAVALFFVFAWVELAWTENAVPSKLATLILAYSLLSWTGMGLFGAAAWQKNADPFARFFGLFARFAPFGVEGGKLILRPFGAGLAQRDLPSAATSGFIVLMLSTVSFDGLSETPLWDSLAGEAMGALYVAGVVPLIGYASAGSLVKTLGLAATPLLFAAVYLPVCALAGRFAGEGMATTARRYGLTLVPIAIAYHLAHYLSYLLIQGQALLPLLSDPLNLGWDLFGTRSREVDIGIIGMESVWFFAVGAIVAGHVAAVALAHRETLRTEGRPTSSPHAVVIAQLPLLVFMVAYTMLSLWILSQPIVTV